MEGRIQDNEASMAAMQKQIRALFRVALCSMPKKIKTMKYDEAILDGGEPRLSVQVSAGAKEFWLHRWWPRAWRDAELCPLEKHYVAFDSEE